jgi:phosphoserine phosphatase
MSRHAIDELLPLLAEHLPRLAGGGGEVAMASDGDHTLWLGDVGEALFEMTFTDGRLRPAALPMLAHEAYCWGVDGQADDPNVIARRLFEAHQVDRYPPQPAFAMMAWAFAGWREDELDAYCQEVLDRFGFEERRRASLQPALDWAVEHDVPFWLVSASPVHIARAAGARLGIPGDRVVAMTPAVTDGVIQPRLGTTATYGEGKCERLREHSQAALLAGMGDSDYDAALLQASAVAVAVQPKPSLLERLADRAGPTVVVER